MNFKSMGLNPKLLESIEKLGFETPTNVQGLAIPKILKKIDLIVMAKTGSGKTGAFAIPMIENITLEKFPQALVLTPTRELAVQVEKDIAGFAKMTDVKSMAIYGQHSMQIEEKQFKEGRQIVVGTPGRTLHQIENKQLNTKTIKYLVLDEADRMLDMGFIDQMIKIIKRLPKDRVTLLFSATMPPEIQRMCQSYMKSPETIALDSDTKTVDSIKQGYYRVERHEKRTQLDRILSFKQPMSCMIFCNTRIEVDKIQNYLSRKGYIAEAIHGANTQSRRMRTIADFKNSEIQIMVATDVAARGLHIEDLQLVINYDLPQEKDSYIHRIGRTGRAGHGGEAISLVTGDDVYALYEIEEHVGTMIEELDLPSSEEIKESLANRTDVWDEKREKLLKAHQNKAKSNYSSNNNTKRHSSSSRPTAKVGASKRPINESKKYDKPHTAKLPEKKVAEHIKKTNQVIKSSVEAKSPVEAKKVVTSQKVKPVVDQVKKPAVEKIVVTPNKKKFALKNIFKKKKEIEIKRFYD